MESVRRTRRAVLVDEGWRPVASRRSHRAHHGTGALRSRRAGRSRVQRRSADTVREHLEEAALPQVPKIVMAVGKFSARPDLGAMIEFRLPSLGAEMDKGTLLEWKVKPGDSVERGSVVAVVDTSKSAIDVEISHEGTVYELPLGLRDRAGGDRHRDAAGARRNSSTRKRRRTQASRRRSSEEAAARYRRQPSSSRVGRGDGSAAAHVAGGTPARGELGVDLTALTGSGPQGAIALEDVDKAAATKAQPQDRASETGMAIGAAMARSKREIPHYYLATDILLERATRWLAARNEAAP